MELYLSTVYYCCMLNEKLKKLGKNVKLERIRNDYSQEKLAELIGVSPRTISLIENGMQHPKFFLVVKIAEVLNVSVDIFI